TVFTMAQGPEALGILREWEDDGLRVVNSVAGVLSTHRHRMCERLVEAGVDAPETVLVSTAAPGRWPSWLDVDGGWLERGDVHATAAGDVRYVAGARDASAGAAELAARGIPQAVVQRHAAGVVLKFYAVAEAFLAWYAPAATPVTLTAEQTSAFEALVGR